jgi:hypothetical protein
MFIQTPLSGSTRHGPWNQNCGRKWKKKDLSSQDMKELVQNMLAKSAERILTLHGFDIFDNRGRKIGDWFSIMGVIMTVEITGEKRVIVHTPPIDTYHS